MDYSIWITMEIYIKGKKHGFRQISQAGTIVNRFTYNWFL